MENTIKLTKDQEKVYNEILSSSERVIVLLGLAGSGKSTLIQYLANSYTKELVLTATTNKAKNLLQVKTGRKAYTIHSFCGFKMVFKDRQEKLEKYFETSFADLVVVDEISMLTEEVFNELLKSKVKKILLVGDMLQLPPIGSAPDLSKYKTLYLVENIRQSNKEVLEFMQTFREMVSKKRAIDFKSATLPSDIKVYHSHKQFCKAYKECESQKRILAYSNRVVDSYNTSINCGERFKVGDYLVLDRPIRNSNAKNGDIARIENIEEKDSHYVLDVSFEYCIYSIIVFKTLSKENEFMNSLTDISSYKFYYELIHHPKLIYASTVHKAQGDTIDEVFIDLRDIYSQLERKPSIHNNYNPPITVEEYLKLVYVAISRMKYKAHLFIGTTRNYKDLYDKKGNRK